MISFDEWKEISKQRDDAFRKIYPFIIYGEEYTDSGSDKIKRRILLSPDAPAEIVDAFNEFNRLRELANQEIED